MLPPACRARSPSFVHSHWMCAPMAFLQGKGACPSCFCVQKPPLQEGGHLWPSCRGRKPALYAFVCKNLGHSRREDTPGSSVFQNVHHVDVCFGLLLSPAAEEEQGAAVTSNS
eukprot:1161335-Pelagomonas_calceolata.AAC.1